jgi:hypothetical protein
MKKRGNTMKPGFEPHVTGRSCSRGRKRLSEEAVLSEAD